MSLIVKLQKDARDSATFRGHHLGVWVRLESRGNGLHARAKCLDCGMDVDIKTHPMPNEIDIGGPAIALGCTSKNSRKETIATKCEGKPFCPHAVVDCIRFIDGDTIAVCQECLMVIDVVLNALPDSIVSWTWDSEKEQC